MVAETSYPVLIAMDRKEADLDMRRPSVMEVVLAEVQSARCLISLCETVVALVEERMSLKAMLAAESDRCF